MTWGVLFSGQGAQHPAMLPWLGGGPSIERMQALLGIGDWRRALEAPAWATRNRHAQVLLTGTALAGWREVAARLPAPAGVVGYSVGEVAAFAAAGVFTAEAALDLAVVRADVMDRCAASSPGGLLAVSGLDEGEVLRLCHGTALTVAIRVGAGSFVVGGPADALDTLARDATAHGAHCTRLPVAVPSHTPAMQGAAEAFDAALRLHALAPPTTTLIANATGDRVADAPRARAALSRQLATTVQWSACVDALHARRVRCVLELGPGRALAAGWNRRHPDVPARAADDFRSVDALCDWVRARL